MFGKAGVGGEVVASCWDIEPIIEIIEIDDQREQENVFRGRAYCVNDEMENASNLKGRKWFKKSTTGFQGGAGISSSR
jgi:hypothetical protein